MNKLKKRLVLALIFAVVLLGVTGCKDTHEDPTGEHPTSEHPSKEVAPQEHPTGEHPK